MTELIDVVSPSFAVTPERLHAGVAALEAMGYRVRLGPHALDQDGYLAGSDERRLADLQRALDSGDSSAVWFARGGYGMARLLDRVRIARPKLLIGHSDLTVLLHAAAGAGGRALHGPFVSELGDAASFDRRSLLAGLAGEPVVLPLSGAQVLAPGKAEGPLVGGNLTVLAHALGTPFAPETRGAVLLLEDVGEETYRLDRLLHHLRLAGVFDGVRAVLLGSFEAPATRRAFPPDRALADVVREVLVPLGVPVVQGLPLGHLPGKWTVPVLGRTTVDTEAGTLTFASPP
ncbi:MAG TPA: LD-carboxypeptidase [Candidatus Polarisedimenticolaceae bacterium]|nr:LD-carboxypeptidase [Candidatus Polarisedimenticolaceae bacterium]